MSLPLSILLPLAAAGAFPWLRLEPAWWRELGPALGQPAALAAALCSLGLIGGALLLASASAELLQLGLGRLHPRWRALLAWPVQAVALLPVAALAWAAVGGWVGRLGWPIESLLPTLTDPVAWPTAWARGLWTWMPPLFLLAIPLGAEWLAFRLTRPAAAASRQLGGLSLLAAAYLVAVEDILGLPGAGARVAEALRAEDPRALLHGGLLLVAVALGLYGVSALYNRRLPPAPAARARPVYEGALAIGWSPWQAWRRHRMPGQLRGALAFLLQAGARVLLVAVVAGSVRGQGPGQEIYQAARRALEAPLAPLQAALPFLLCALSLAVLGRIIAPRPD